MHASAAPGEVTVSLGVHVAADAGADADELTRGADAALYILWLEERLASGETDVPGVLRFYPHPRPWHAEWISLH